MQLGECVTVSIMANNSSSSTHQQKQEQPDPHQPVSPEVLDSIITSPGKLRAWNNLNAQALALIRDHLNPQVVKNIQLTGAAVVAHTNTSTLKDPEQIRALALYQQTLSYLDIAKGAVKGLEDTLQAKVQDLRATTQAFVSNITPKKLEELYLKTPVEVITTTATVAKTLAQRPQLIPQAVNQLAEAKQAEVKNQLVQGMRSDNPSTAIGGVMGATAVDVAPNALDPRKKVKVAADVSQNITKASASTMSWPEYGRLLGEGTHPPKQRPLRDFSGAMKAYTAGPDDPINLPGLNIEYWPSDTHGIHTIIKEGAMGFAIEAKDNRYAYGSGMEMVLSTIKIAHDHYVDINELHTFWEPGRMGSQYDHVHKAIMQNPNMDEQAYKKLLGTTFSGKLAGRLGLTDVAPEKAGTESVLGHYRKYGYLQEQIITNFVHPDWGAGEQMNNYSHKYALAHGRPGIELTASVVVSPSASLIPKEMLDEVLKLPEAQQGPVLKNLKAIFTLNQTEAVAMESSR